MLGQRRRRGPTLNQHWLNIPCLLVSHVYALPALCNSFVEVSFISQLLFAQDKTDDKAFCPGITVRLGTMKDEGPHQLTTNILTTKHNSLSDYHQLYLLDRLKCIVLNCDEIKS